MKPIPDWLRPYKDEWRTIGGLLKIMRSESVAFPTWLREVAPRLKCVIDGYAGSRTNAAGGGPVRKYLVKHVWAVAQAHAVDIQPTGMSNPLEYIAELEKTVEALRSNLASSERRLSGLIAEGAKNLRAQVLHREGHTQIVPKGNGHLPAALAIRLILSRAPSMVPGVYFLIHKNEVVYIGQSIATLQRMAGHSDKDFDEVRVVEVHDTTERLALEKALITEFKPKYNVMCTGRPNKTEIAISEFFSKSLETA